MKRSVAYALDHLVFVRGGALFAQPFDVVRHRTRATPVAIAAAELAAITRDRRESGRFVFSLFIPLLLGPAVPRYSGDLLTSADLRLLPYLFLFISLNVGNSSS